MNNHFYTPQWMAQFAQKIEPTLENFLKVLPKNLNADHTLIYREVCIVMMRVVSMSFWSARQEQPVILSCEYLEKISGLPLWDNANTPVLSSIDFSLGEVLRDFNEAIDVDLSEVPLEQLGAFYEHLLQTTLGFNEDGWHLQSTATRKKTGTHYTPPELCHFLVEQALDQLSNTVPINDLRTCDPAMGSGAFLLEMTRQLVDRTQVDSEQIVSGCIYGVDINPIAVWVTQFSLWLLVGTNRPIKELTKNLCIGNSLFYVSRAQAQRISFDETSEVFVEDDRLEQVRDEMLNYFQLKVRHDWSARSASKNWSKIGSESGQAIQFGERPMHWDWVFDEVMQTGGFHIVIGNPPFVNAIKGGVSQLMKAFLPKRYSLVRGAADLSYYFLALGVELLRKDGVLGYILPRVMLGANALQPFRTSPKRPKPIVLYSPDHTDYFANAQIRVVAALFGSGGSLRVSRSDSVLDADWSVLSNDDSNWWSAYRGNWWTLFEMGTKGLSFPLVNNHRTLLDAGFEVRGGLVASEFYQVNVVEQVDGRDLKLLTSGGIDPKEQFWGSQDRTQRFRKIQYTHPRVLESDEYPKALQKKLRLSRRPKIILANQTSVIEGYFDRLGEFQASTATMEIYHKEDSLESLQLLIDWLHGNVVHQLFHLCLGFNALGPGLSLSKPFLQQLPVPKG
tara:strand:+ start:571 stop:2598 length:2028 start_codon:yes stop_codon:yes gene_type:complete